MSGKSSSPRLSLASITKNNLGTLKKLNSVIFPVHYTAKFYEEVLSPETEEYCKLIYYNDVPVGTVCGRIEKDAKDGRSRVYIMTMGVLAPYRSIGLGAHMLEHILKAASSPTAVPKISAVYLHVQISNEAAKRFYERQGFKEVGLIENYYKKIEPRQAWVMEWDTPPVTAAQQAAEPAPTASKAEAPKPGGKKKGGKQ